MMQRREVSMRHLFAMIFLIVLGLSASAARASPDGSEAKPWHVYLGDARSRYPEQEPNDTCGEAQAMIIGDVVTPAFLQAGEQDWYAWNMFAGDLLICGTDIVNEGDNTDTYIELYAQDCVTLLAFNDDGGPGYYSRIESYGVPYTGVYYLKVRGYGGSTTGPYTFYVNQDIGGLPIENDLCSGAIEIMRCTSGSLQGDTSNANDDYDPGVPGPSCTGYTASGRDVVYSINAMAGDVLDLTYRQLNTDASFYIVTDCSNVSGSCVAGADETVPPDPEVIRYTVATPGVYYVILDSYGQASGGSWTLDFSILGCIPEACCFADGRCELSMPSDCRQLGGIPQGSGTTCDPNPCTVTGGACCYVDGHCEFGSETDCGGNGVFQGEGTTCDPNPCMPTPSRNATWGQIKGSYHR
jgi:hypothetical protein